MLDTDTRRRIDTARDILVGKVPDPKSQVEQITIALIYKFMNDMDAESEELGGKRTFFADEFERYGWARLMTPRIGGQEMLNLYAEAIARMPENPGIPTLFRDIFKNAYLPYRDPETLRAFLRIIDDFTYDHSERLGDAFEYLLSVLGSQGDAGQFRTPRHIIDFMVAIVDPRKDERILDPACGTAGFLISAYKHILNANSREGRPGAALAPDERARLMGNVHGYDISPDMVRLSLVNLYLHGFNNPQVDEYDTLTSEDKWTDYYHVILANPPFMSPKGGIRPHKRFTVQSNRSEVLFVDYIAEHLLPGGRAAVIVPEGVIFQSGNAYKALRKLLVERYLAGVISLPAGVFNPYSGVKTSILWLDKTIAQATDSILFVKIEADGFDLGAQRKESRRNDLPEALAEILAYKANIPGSKETFQDNHRLLTLVPRTDISQTGEYILSGERYNKSQRNSSTSWPIVSLSEVCSFMTGGTPTSTVDEYYKDGNVRWLVSGDVHKGIISDCQGRITELGVQNSNAKYLPKNSVLIALNGQGKTRGAVALLRMEKATCNQSLVAITPTNDDILRPEYLYYVLRSMYQDIRDITGDNQRSGLNIPILKSLQIPLPPLAEQEAIVAEVESYQRIVDGARQVVANYRPRIEVDAEWPVVALGEVCLINNETAEPTALFGDDEFIYIDISSVENGTGKVSFENLVRTRNAPSRARRVVQQGDVLLSTVRPNLKAFAYLEMVPENAIASTGFAVLKAKQQIMPKYLFYIANEEAVVSQMIARMGKGSYPSINQKDVSEIEIPLPPIEVQKKIIAEIDFERALVQSNRELITRFEQKIKARVGRVWGEEN